MEDKTRDEVIWEIAEEWAETLVIGGLVAEVLVEGRKGLREYADNELEIEYEEKFGKKIKIME